MGNMFSSNSSDDEVIQALQQPNRLVIDCRSAGEFACGDGFEDAKNMPVGSIESRLSEVGDKDRTVITYCAAGVRACRGTEILKHAGFSHVFSTTNAGHLRDLVKRIPK